MKPFFVLVGCLLLLLLAGGLGVRRLRDPVVCLRLAVAALFLFTASAHFSSLRPDLVRMVPPVLPSPETLVTITGIAEVVGAVALLVPCLAPWAAGGLGMMLVAMFPANVHAALTGGTIGGAPVLDVVPRGLLQLLFLAAVISAGFGRRILPVRLAASSNSTGASSPLSTRPAPTTRNTGCH